MFYRLAGGSAHHPLYSSEPSQLDNKVIPLLIFNQCPVSPADAAGDLPFILVDLAKSCPIPCSFNEEPLMVASSMASCVHVKIVRTHMRIPKEWVPYSPAPAFQLQ